MGGSSGFSPSVLAVLDTRNRETYLCYTCRGTGSNRLSLTDGRSVWSSDLSQAFLSACSPLGHMGAPSDCPSVETFLQDLSASCRTGAVTVTTGPAHMDLHDGTNGPMRLLQREEEAAREELKELLISMARRLTGGSPVKQQLRSSADDLLHTPTRSSPSSTNVTRKKRPGRSLINPGSRAKLQPGGVSFDD